MQERMQPFDSTLLNNIEGIGLFSLIFTQIVSILYLYIDTRTAATGKKDLTLEIAITLVLLFANILVVSTMIGGYLYAWAVHRRRANMEYLVFEEQRDEPYGAVTKIKNPHVEPPTRLKLFRTIVDCAVYFKPSMASETTGEIAESGNLVLMDGTVEVNNCVCVAEEKARDENRRRRGRRRGERGGGGGGFEALATHLSLSCFIISSLSPPSDRERNTLRSAAADAKLSS